MPPPPEPKEFIVASTCDVDAIGSAMASNTYSNDDGDGVLSCLVWGNNNAPKSVTWERNNAVLAHNPAARVLISYLFSSSSSFLYG